MKNSVKAFIMAAAVAATMAVPAMAAAPVASGETTVRTAGGTGTSRLDLNVVYSEGTIHGDMFSAVVPAIIPITGQVNKVEAICPTNVEIRNNNVERAIKVTNLKVNSGNWTVTDYTSGNFSAGNNIGIQFNGAGTNSSGVINVVSGNWTAPASGKLALPMKAKISKQSRPSESSNAATVIFTLNFA